MRHGLESLEAWIIPLGLFQKSMFLRFDLRSSAGESLPLLSRAADSEVATEILLEIVRREKPTAPAASPRIRNALLHIVFDMKIVRLTASIRRLNSESTLTEEERQWFRAALRCSVFLELLENLSGSSIALCAIPKPQSDTIVKVVRNEETPPLFRTAKTSPSGYLKPFERIAPYRLVAIDLPDFGWARSDHFQFSAPEGTFVTDAIGFSIDDERIQYDENSSAEHMVFYAHAQRASPSFFLAHLWPTPRGALRPSLILVLYISLMLLSGGVAEVFTYLYSCHLPPFQTEAVMPLTKECQSASFLWQLDDKADAAMALSFVGPTLTLAYVLKGTDPLIRLSLLERWRHLAVFTLFPGLAGSTMLLLNRDLLAHWVLGSAWILFSIPAGLIAGIISIYWFQVSSAYKRAMKRRRANWSVAAKHYSAQDRLLFIKDESGS